MADGSAVSVFFSFSVSCLVNFVSFLFNLPLFGDGFSISFGDGLVALTLLMIIVTAFVRVLAVANFSEEAHIHNARDRYSQRLNPGKGKKG